MDYLTGGRKNYRRPLLMHHNAPASTWPAEGQRRAGSAAPAVVTGPQGFVAEPPK
jgi:hypothetical protein